MAISSQAAVTPDGIHDGDPAALAALVERRANAVLAYCEAVCPPAAAERAAAEAFARFRAAVATAEDPRALDPGTLLLGATRHAAASLTVTPTPPADNGLRRRLGAVRGLGASETCALIPDLLAARAEGALSTADRERLARHLERHPACRALADAIDRAEAAYASPPSRMVPIGALTEIMLALAAAAPITAVPGAELEFGEVAFAEAATVEPEAAGDPRYEEPRIEPELEAEPQHAEPPTEPALAEPGYAEPPNGPEQTDPGPVAAPAPEPTTTVFRAVATDEVDEPPRADTSHTVVLPPAAAIAMPAAAGGVAHPRPMGRHLHLPSPTRSHGALYHYVLPGAFVAAALLAAMGVAGVFSADERPPAAASPIITNAPVAPPAGAPPVTPQTNDAEERTALAAERRTRRKRAAAAKRSRARKAAPVPSPTTQTETTPPVVAVPNPDPEPAPAPAPAPTPRRTPPQTSTAEKEPPAESSSALPDTGTATTPSADPGVFEGTPPPAP